MIDVGRPTLSMKGTLLEGEGAPGTGTGGGLIPVPDVVPGVVKKLFQPLTIENLLSANSQKPTRSGMRSKARRQVVPPALPRVATSPSRRSGSQR